MKIAQVLHEVGLPVFTVDLDQEEAVIEIGQRIGAGALKVFDTMKFWPDAYRRYHRDEDGKLPVEGHGLMRATQLLALYGPNVAISENRAQSDGDELDLNEEWPRPTDGILRINIPPSKISPSPLISDLP